MKTTHLFPFTVNLGLSLATCPFVVGCLVLQSMTQNAVEFGQISEEILRGVRLPVLKFTENSIELE
ncbi:hypothetical protein STA3757_01380 [Stanieria sp. NIES-3757]|nr:hypothetical protein STA3757_01380 [Stanieria sp. NIES-3757]